MNKLFTNWSDKVRKHKENLDEYQKYIAKLDGAFDKLSNTSGLKNIGEIVTAFIKSEEQ